MSSSSSGPPWHQNVLGNATDALVYIFSAILIFTVLSGKWWIMLYLVVGVVIFCVILLYTFYLEYNAQEYLEMQHKLARKRPRLGRVE